MDRHRIHSDFDPFKILQPSIIPIVPGGMPGHYPFFRPTQGPGTGPGSGGGSIRARIPVRLGPVEGIIQPLHQTP